MTMFLHVVCCSFGAWCTEPRYKDARLSLGFKISCIFFAPPNFFTSSPPPTFRQPTVQHFESPPIMSFAETFVAHFKTAMIYVATTVSHFEAEVLHIPASLRFFTQGDGPYVQVKTGIYFLAPALDALIIIPIMDWAQEKYTSLGSRGRGWGRRVQAYLTIFMAIRTTIVMARALEIVMAKALHHTYLRPHNMLTSDTLLLTHCVWALMVLSLIFIFGNSFIVWLTSPGLGQRCLGALLSAWFIASPIIILHLRATGQVPIRDQRATSERQHTF
jgi:hypothetical protein